MKFSIVSSFVLLSPTIVSAIAVSSPRITDAPVLKREDEEENPYATYPSVARTASINGFADLIYDQMPDCAKACMYANTGVTPCPYWDTGCLCIMPDFVGEIAQCVAESCRGQDVNDVRSLATSQCSRAGVWDPYWMLNADDDALLSSAAAQTTESSSSSSLSSISSSSSLPQETEGSESSEIQPSNSSSQPTTTDLPISSSSSSTTAIARTATINGFADRVYDNMPECAKSCLDVDTGVCPYWDTGCLCVLPNIAGPIGACIAENCSGEDVVTATQLGQSACSSAGVTNSGYWLYPESVAAQLAYAATALPSSSTTIESSVTSESSEFQSSFVSQTSEVSETSFSSQSASTESSLPISSDFQSSLAPVASSSVTESLPSEVSEFLSSSSIANQNSTIFEQATITETICTLCTQQSSLNNEQSSINNVHSSVISEVNKVITTVVSCESEKASIETILKTATETVVINSCNSVKSELESIETEAYHHLSSLEAQQESCVSKITELAQSQQSIASEIIKTATDDEYVKSIQNQASIAQNNAIGAYQSGEDVKESINSLISQETAIVEEQPSVQLANEGNKNIITLTFSIIFISFISMMI
ncbi:unnamed protein product [Candida verbasci]|uniref:CFEM domain-containing protein n=1 Tax=Candida verbasci TaxID=1227364 RepID=A0A9W4XC41_9ASCO|nr:unnamed protein product [Candida verbasci]